jgi:glycosyltransferase involved in cell wall biosynthesis
VEFEIALARTAHVRWETESAALPAAVEEILTLHPEWKPQQLLEHFGWRVRDAAEVVRDFERYRDFIWSSRAEWSVAKNGYVRGRSGWFSGRSACYLAAGRPVVVQDTGLGSVLPVDRGVVTFSNLEEAIAGVRAVDSDYERHARAAREIASEFFDSDKILPRLLSEAML